MTPKRHRLVNQCGFTLAELLVAMATISLAMAGVFLLQQSGQQAYLLGSNRVEAQQNARIALDLMTRELRSATSITTIANCNGGNNPPPDISFIDQNSPPKTIRYSLSNGTLNRTENGTTTALVGRISRFAMTCVPNNAATVRTVGISIVAKTDEDASAGSPGDQRATMESTVQLRNRS